MCLCGHFEWCDECRSKPDPPGTYEKATLADWQRSIKVALPEDTQYEKTRKMLRRRTA